MSATAVFVINAFFPVSTYSSPSRTATVSIESGSEPAEGSVKAKAPSLSPVHKGLRYISFCASEPAYSMGNMVISPAELKNPMLALTLASSSNITI